MNGAQEAPAGAPLAAHFEAKRRIMTTVRQMEERGEKLEEATPEEVLEAASKAAETVFKFDFSVSADGADGATKRSRNRKRNKKRRAKKTQDEAAAAAEKSGGAAAAPTTGRPVDAVTPAPPQRGKAKDGNRPAPRQKKRQGATTKDAAAKAAGASSFLKLRKATGTESEVAKMHLRYGQGRRNVSATKQREQRKKTAADPRKAGDGAASSDFKFNFAASS
ncbi:hypothetical protein PHYPSEUDO_015253 [Phytophthora pseudosyringae]|uniref:Uncharacterized protein n=1 Tax=Phytophthora pseudosyringae TaxID=221518 RepID=A0A8T1V600_9STRA|nr:hypothetical protein PHYPSEUDO_015253 [Phytophthora pseudosyringae]